MSKSKILRNTESPLKEPQQLLPTPFEIVDEYITHKQFNEAGRDISGIVRVNEDGELIKQYIQFAGLTQYLIDVYDDMIEKRLSRIVKRDTVLHKDKAIVDFNNVIKRGPKADEFPEHFRKTNGTYGMDIYADVRLWVTKKTYLQIQIDENTIKSNSAGLSTNEIRNIERTLENLQRELSEMETKSQPELEGLRLALRKEKNEIKKTAIKNQIKQLEGKDNLYIKLDNQRRRRIIDQHNLVDNNVPPIPGMILLTTEERRHIFSVPIMLGSKHCLLYPYIRDKNIAKLKELGEDPLDPFGYFIINGNEKIVVTQQKLRLYKPLLYKDSKSGDVIVQMQADTVSRGTIITKLITSNVSDIQPDTNGTNINGTVAKKNNKNKVIPDENQYIKILISSQRSEQAEMIAGKMSEVDELLAFRNKSKKSYQSGIRNVYVHFLHIFRVLGIETDSDVQDIILTFARPEYRKLLKIQLIPSMHHLIEHPDSYEYLASVMDIQQYGSREDFEEKIRTLIESDIIPHFIPPYSDNEQIDAMDPLSKYPNITSSNRYKIYTLSIMAIKMLEYMTPGSKGGRLRGLDDRDSLSNNLLKTPGPAIEQLIRSAWSESIKKARRSISKKENNNIIDLFNTFNKSISAPVTKDLILNSFRSSTWGVTPKSAKNNIAQNLEVNNLIAKIEHIRLILISRNKSSSLEVVREVQPTMFAFICVTKSPEGGNCGMLRGPVMTVKISLARNEYEVLLQIKLGKILFNYPADEHPNPLILNGIFIGWCESQSAFKKLKKMKQFVKIPYDTGVVRTNDGYLNVHTDGDRAIIPLMVMDESGTQTLLEKDRDKLMKNKNIDFNYLMSHGYMEYIDSWEQEYVMLAADKTDIDNRKRALESAQILVQQEKYYLEEVVSEGTDEEIEKSRGRVEEAERSLVKELVFRKYDYMLLDPIAILSFSAATIPLPNHNQGPRNTYETSMVKQAMAGMYHWNQSNRFDGTIKLLEHVNKPLFSTITEDFIGLSERPQGQNVIVAFWAHPYTQEDSFVVSQRFVDLGGFMYTKIIEFKTVVKNTSATEEILQRPAEDALKFPQKYKFIGDNGLPMINAYLLQGDCIIAKIKRDKITTNTDDHGVYMPIGEEGRVKDVNVSKNIEGQLVVRVKIIVRRKPQVGDKFANRTSQKGTIGLILPYEEMPYTADGMRPDFIINPHSVSRMTGAYFIELLTGLYTTIYGDPIDATAFRPVNIPFIQDALAKAGFSSTGKQIMYDGISGEMIPDAIFIGPAYFHALKHNVRDKVQARGLRGPVSLTTRQPVSGRASLGGLRFGEMEISEIIAHGASRFMQERLCKLASSIPVIICNKCKIMAEHRRDTKSFQCRLCKTEKDLQMLELPFAFMYFSALIAANGLLLRLEVDNPNKKTEEENEEELEEEELPEELLEEEIEDEEGIVLEEEEEEVGEEKIRDWDADQEEESEEEISEEEEGLEDEYLSDYDEE